jgi:hypothetical protein
VTATEATRRADEAMLALLALHDAIKDDGIEAEFPYPHRTGANASVQKLDEAHRAAAEAARLLSKLAAPGAVT